MPPHNQATHDRYNSEAHPARPFGSALGGKYGGQVERCPVIGPTIKPRFVGPCAVCGESRFWCEHELGGDE